MNQDTLRYFISRQGGATTEVEALTHINSRGRAKVKVIQKGILLAEVGDIIQDFSLLYGVLRFVKTVDEVRMLRDTNTKYIDF